MVRNYKKKTKRGEWSQESMKAAIDEVLSKNSGYRKAALEHNIPQTTLERYVKKIKRGEEITVGLPLGPMKSVFSQNEEKELAEYVKHMEERLFGLTTLDLRRLAYQLAVKNNKKHNFNNEKEMAGVDWLNGFLKRNPDLSIRKPEATSAARAMGFNRVAVGNFYQLLGETYDAFHFTPDKIYNCDETGISVVSKTKSKIIALKGRKQVGSLSSAERGQTVTVEICFNAAGTYMPPFIIFPRQRMKPELLDNAPPGTTSVCNPKGWITVELFTLWFKKFIQFTGASPSNKVLLLLDGHVSHTQNIDVIDLARQHGVVIICFPPHCTHKMQPADVGFMRPLSTYYDHAASNWLRSHPGRVITMFQISEIFGQAYMQAATMSTAVNSFRKCGIWPYNQDNFSDADFIAAETTNIPLAQDNPSTSRAIANIPPHSGLEVSTTSNFVNAQSMETEPHTEPEIPSASSSAILPSTESVPHSGREEPTMSSLVNAQSMETESQTGSTLISANFASTESSHHSGHKVPATSSFVNDQSMEIEPHSGHESPSTLSSAYFASTKEALNPGYEVPAASSFFNACSMETEAHTGSLAPSTLTPANLLSTESASRTESDDKRGSKFGHNTSETEQVPSIHEDLLAPVLSEHQRTPAQLSTASSPQQDFEMQTRSSLEIRSPIRAVCRDLTSSFDNASPKDILPIPAVQMSEKRKNYRRGKTVVITSTPYKKELEALKLSKNAPAKNKKSSTKVLPAKKSKSSKKKLLKILGLQLHEKKIPFVFIVTI